MKVLDHSNPDCTGDWRDHQAAEGASWVCSGCGGSHPHSPAVREAVAWESYLSTLLLLLSVTGRRQRIRRRIT